MTIGAMGIDKVKETARGPLELLRFISIMTSINNFMRLLDGDAKRLPYLGHALLIILGDCEEALVDSEDLESCFNLFVQPSTWKGFTAFEKKVSGWVAGRRSPFRVGIRTVPMGYRGAVDLVQNAVRHLVFDEARVPRSLEVSKGRRFPTGPDYAFVMLDSLDLVRVLDAGIARALEDTDSDNHKRFVEACRQHRLSLNKGKRLLGSFRATLQGGEFHGDVGLYAHARARGRHLQALTVGMLLESGWPEGVLRHWAGLACLTAAYRRPLFSVLQEVFVLAQSPEPFKEAPKAVLEELLVFMGLLPFASGNLRAGILPQVSISDASPYGGASAVASRFSALVPSCARAPPQGGTGGPGGCPRARRATGKYACPGKCGEAFVTMEAVVDHRKGEACVGVPRVSLPRFGEFFSGPNAPLTKAVARQAIDVESPIDILRPDGFDCLAAGGRQKVAESLRCPALLWRHWAPDRRLMLRSQRSSATLKAGEVIRGPPPVRGRRYPRGFPWLEARWRRRLQKANTLADMGLKDLERCHKGHAFAVIEHPLRSWLFAFPLASRLRALDGVFFTRFFQQVKGGGGFKLLGLLHNNLALDARFHNDGGPQRHEEDEDYQEEELIEEDFVVNAEGAEYPSGMCEAYAEVVQHSFLEVSYRLLPYEPAGQATWFADELSKATARLRDATNQAIVSQELRDVVALMWPGSEDEHLKDMMTRIDPRGSDIQLWAGQADRASAQLAPYPPSAGTGAW